MYVCVCVCECDISNESKFLHFLSLKQNKITVASHGVIIQSLDPDIPCFALFH